MGFLTLNRFCQPDQFVWLQGWIYNLKPDDLVLPGGFVVPNGVATQADLKLDWSIIARSQHMYTETEGPRTRGFPLPTRTASIYWNLLPATLESAPKKTPEISRSARLCPPSSFSTMPPHFSKPLAERYGAPGHHQPHEENY